jgi:hypothetical protein
MPTDRAAEEAAIAKFLAERGATKAAPRKAQAARGGRYALFDVAQEKIVCVGDRSKVARAFAADPEGFQPMRWAGEWRPLPRNEMFALLREGEENP